MVFVVIDVGSIFGTKSPTDVNRYKTGHAKAFASYSPFNFVSEILKFGTDQEPGKSLFRRGVETV
jgi:hypothetical protein